MYGSGPGAQSVLQFLVTRAHVNLDVWGTEDDVLNSTCSMMLALVGRKQVRPTAALSLLSYLSLPSFPSKSLHIFPPVCVASLATQTRPCEGALLHGVTSFMRFYYF